MKILFFGDIVGRIGRHALAKILPPLRKEHGPDLVVANGENMAHGMGITVKTLKDVRDAGVDVVTSGNHIAAKDEFITILTDPESRVLRPANYPEGVPGKGALTLEINGKTITIINLLGRVFIHEDPDCPFRTTDKLLDDPRIRESDIIIVDFHAEATSEKTSLGWYLDGRVSAVVGTHTHVPTADQKILTSGTAYITDIGMVGGKDGVIGFERGGPTNGFLTQLNTRFEVIESGAAQVNSVLMEFDDNGKATSIERLDREALIG